MIKKESRNAGRIARHKRIRKNLHGTSSIPRLCVFKSNTNIFSSCIKPPILNNYILYHF